MTLSRNLRCAAVLFAVIQLGSLSLSAQTITGDIAGDVTDATGAVVPNVTVTVQNTNTGLARTTVTSGTGSYRVPALPIGPYKVSASAQGFKTVIQNAQVLAGGISHADFKLAIGERAETIEVQGAAPLVDLSPNENNYVDNAKIENVPINGRDFNSLLAIT